MVLFPTEFAYRIDSGGSSRLIDTPLMTFTTTRRCDGQCCHDDFLLGKYERGWCKTAFKPYDVAVTEALLIAKHHYGDDIKITSCGSDKWWDARSICQRVLGYGNSFRCVPKQRFSEFSGQWIEEEVFEEIPGNQVFDPVNPEAFREGRHEGRSGRLEKLALRLLEAKTPEELFL